MAFSGFKLFKLILREAVHATELERCPEPSSVMENPTNVESFHAQGADKGALIPIYHFNALAISSLLPYCGSLVDLGSGSGQFLSSLARYRPDCRIIGIELSEGMVNLGNKALRESNLDTAIRLDIGDMTRFSWQISERVDIVSSIFAFHHLPSFVDLNRCLAEISILRKQWGCGVWLFDHARPRTRETAEIFPELFTPEATESFRRDSTNSLLASFSFRELSERIDTVSMGTFIHECSRILRLYQIHWLRPERKEATKGAPVCRDMTLRPEEQRAFRQLKTLFRRTPF
jgi:SAM-dependent methyltransferase